MHSLLAFKLQIASDCTKHSHSTLPTNERDEGCFETIHLKKRRTSNSKRNQSKGPKGTSYKNAAKKTGDKNTSRRRQQQWRRVRTQRERESAKQQSTAREVGTECGGHIRLERVEATPRGIKAMTVHQEKSKLRPHGKHTKSPTPHATH